MITLSIIILSYNTKDLTLQCITSLIQHCKKQLESKKYEIILVDNNSEDDTISAVKKQFPSEVLIIENKKNLGFSKGNNVGSKSANGEYLLFLNSDTQLLTDGFDDAISYLSRN